MLSFLQERAENVTKMALIFLASVNFWNTLLIGSILLLIPQLITIIKKKKLQEQIFHFKKEQLA